MFVIFIIMITAMASLTNDTARAYSDAKSCLGAGLDANGAIDLQCKIQSSPL